MRAECAAEKEEPDKKSDDDRGWEADGGCSDLSLRPQWGQAFAFVET
jgi:hypothetical protein